MSEVRYVTGYLVDEDGFVIETVPIDLHNYDKESGIIVKQPNDVFYKFRWDGTDWIEGATQEEIDEITKVEPSSPTHEERIKELETIVNLLLMGGL